MRRPIVNNLKLKHNLNKYHIKKFINNYEKKLWKKIHEKNYDVWKKIMCDSICKNRSYRPWQEIQYFVTNTKTHQYSIKFRCQTEVALARDLLLLAAFASPLAIHMGDLGSWWSSGEKVADCVWL